MKISKKAGPITGLVVVAGFTATLVAGTYSSIQSTLRPLSLTIADKVQVAGSDSTSAAFETVKTGYINYCSTMLPEGVAFTGSGLYQLDPQRLYFLFDYAPRVYFIKDGACYTNALGATIATMSAPSSSILTGNTFTIFPSASCGMGVCGSGNNVRSAEEPLLYGDYVQLPTVKAGQQLSFFLMANLTITNNSVQSSKRKGKITTSGNASTATPESVYYNGTDNNPDAFQHMIAFFPDNSQYVIIGFEDMYGGGDKDCNDVMFVVDVGPMNALMWRDASSLPK